MSNPVFDEIMRTRKPDLEQQPEGYVWLTMLIRFTTDGKAEVIRSFAKPAKDSAIKGLVKPKKIVPERTEITTEITEDMLF